MTPSLAFMKFTLPRSVFISPLWANTLHRKNNTWELHVTSTRRIRISKKNTMSNYLRGWARSQLGKVFVENLVWTNARYVSNWGFWNTSWFLRWKNTHWSATNKNEHSLLSSRWNTSKADRMWTGLCTRSRRMIKSRYRIDGPASESHALLFFAKRKPAQQTKIYSKRTK